MKSLVIALAALMLAGCTETWKRIHGPDAQGSDALISVMSFVATNGWNMYTNEGGIFWEELESKCYISGLP